MRVAVIGANGRTGTQVLEQGLSRGHHMIAMVRRLESQTIEHRSLATVSGDILDPSGLVGALDGCDAVVSTVGIGTSRAPTVIYSQGITNVVDAMREHAITKLAVVSAAPAAPRTGQPFLERRVVMPLLERFFGETYADMRRMEQALRNSDVDWVALRPPRLVDKPASGRYRVSIEPLPKARTLTYSDLGTALIDSLDGTALHRTPAFVAN